LWIKEDQSKPPALREPIKHVSIYANIAYVSYVNIIVRDCFMQEEMEG
jgi:hypothetical protein